MYSITADAKAARVGWTATMGLVAVDLAGDDSFRLVAAGHTARGR